MQYFLKTDEGDSGTIKKLEPSVSGNWCVPPFFEIASLRCNLFKLVYLLQAETMI